MAKLIRLDLGWRRQLKLGAEDTVPETARHTEAILEIGKMMLEMVLLQLLVVVGQAADRSAMKSPSPMICGLLTCDDEENNVSCRNIRIQRYRHNMPERQHASCRKSLREQTCRRVQQE